MLAAARCNNHCTDVRFEELSRQRKEKLIAFVTLRRILFAIVLCLFKTPYDYIASIESEAIVKIRSKVTRPTLCLFLLV